MRLDKKKLVRLAKLVEQDEKLTPDDISYFLNFQKRSEEKTLTTVIKSAALPLSLALGFFSSVFPKAFSEFIATLPSWTNMSPALLSGVDYLWSLLGDPVGKQNIVYHIPNIALYAVGFFGIKKLFEAIEKHTWLDRVLHAQKQLLTRITEGQGNFLLSQGHSLLFVGKGDFIGMQFVLNQKNSDVITVSENKPGYTLFWNRYDVTTMFEDIKKILERCDGENAGEYIFFPVVDSQIFLPGPKAYDVSPHQLDILVTDLRTVEKEHHWKPKRVIIIGDRFHTSFVQSEDSKKVVPKSQESITLETVAKKYKPAIILDPTDVVLEHIIKIARGRKIVFRATREGLKEYKKRFYERLKLLGYKQRPTRKGILTIGYDLYEDQTEQQTLSRSVDDYFPVVLSKAVYDALIRNGYEKDEFIYVPDLVLRRLRELAGEQ